MTRYRYIVVRYIKHAVFDKNMNLVWRWYLQDRVYCTTIKQATRFFRTANYSPVNRAVIRAIKKGGKKNVKRELHL